MTEKYNLCTVLYEVSFSLLHHTKSDIFFVCQTVVTLPTQQRVFLYQMVTLEIFCDRPPKATWIIWHELGCFFHFMLTNEQTTFPGGNIQRYYNSLELSVFSKILNMRCFVCDCCSPLQVKKPSLVHTHNSVITSNPQTYSMPTFITRRWSSCHIRRPSCNSLHWVTRCNAEKYKTINEYHWFLSSAVFRCWHLQIFNSDFHHIL